MSAEQDELSRLKALVESHESRLQLLENLVEEVQVMDDQVSIELWTEDREGWLKRARRSS